VSQGERKVLSKVVPIYPQLARKANLSGVVKLDAVVAPDGKVQFTQLVGGNPIFVQAAEDAVRKWRFEPASKQTVERIELRFNR
jgi:TonB family protein